MRIFPRAIILTVGCRNKKVKKELNNKEDCKIRLKKAAIGKER